MTTAARLLVVVVALLVLSLACGKETATAPLPQPTASPVPTATSLPTPTTAPLANENISIPLPPGAVQLVVSKDDPVTLVSPSGEITISSDAGAVGETTVLVFEPLEVVQLPDLPEGLGLRLTPLTFRRLPRQATGLRRSSLTSR